MYEIYVSDDCILIFGGLFQSLRWKIIFFTIFRVFVKSEVYLWYLRSVFC